MAIIDPSGLFHGTRLARCSDKAQLFWPRFLLAANGFGRVNLNYQLLLQGPLASLHTKPSMEEILLLFREYRDNYLAFLYVHDGEIWAQWDVPQRLISKYQTAADRRSPAPPIDAFNEWKDAYKRSKAAEALDLLNYEVIHTTSITKAESTISENFQTTSNHLDSCQLGVGVGVGIGEGKTSPLPPKGEPTAKRKRRTRDEMFSEFSPETKTVVNELLSIWPSTRRGNKSRIVPDVPLLASRIDTLLQHPKLDASLLLASANRYIAEDKDYPHAPEFFFGPGKDGEPPWRPYARMEYHERQSAATQETDATRSSVRSDALQTHLPTTGTENPPRA